MDGKETNYTSRVDVLALSMPYKVLSENKTTSLIKTVHNRSDGMTVTVEVHTPEVPGGVVAHTSKQLDLDGNLIRRSTLELVDYSVARPASRPLKRLIDRMRRIKLYGYIR